MAELPLQGYRIVNFGWVAAAPYVGSYLADMGAEVVKVESTKRIDSLRLSPDNLDRDPDRDPWFHSGVRGQLSITIFTNLRLEKDEFNFLRERKKSGARKAFHEMHRRYEDLGY